MNTEEDIKQKKLMRKSRNKKIRLYAFLFFLFCYIWARIEYNNIKIKHIVLESSDIPKEFDVLYNNDRYTLIAKVDNE